MTQHVKIVGIDELEPIAKDIFEHSVMFAVREPPATSKGIDAILNIPDKEFPFTSNEPMTMKDGLTQNSQVSIVGQHIVFNISLLDDDRTQNRKEIKLVFCPQQSDESIKNFVEFMANRGASNKPMNLVLMGTFAYEVMLKISPTMLESASRTAPDLMRHSAIMNLDVSMVTLTAITNMLIYRDMDPGYKAMSKYCPICKGGQNENA
jgi:hypothetical protein